MTVKEQFKRFIDELPPEATWDTVVEGLQLLIVSADGARDISQVPAKMAEELIRDFVVGAALL
jgi:hypothetical protein